MASLPLRLLAGQYRHELGHHLLWLPGLDRPGYPPPLHCRLQRLRPGDHTPGQPLVPLAGVKADEYTLRTTQNPETFISAMTRLANQNLTDADPPTWLEFLLHSHPSISRRVAMAKSFRHD